MSPECKSIKVPVNHHYHTQSLHHEENHFPMEEGNVIPTRIQKFSLY